MKMYTFFNIIITLDKMKDAIIAKIASRAEELYSDTLKLMQKETVQHLWDKVSNVMINNLLFLTGAYPESGAERLQPLPKHLVNIFTPSRTHTPAYKV